MGQKFKKKPTNEMIICSMCGTEVTVADVLYPINYPTWIGMRTWCPMCHHGQHVFFIADNENGTRQEWLSRAVSANRAFILTTDRNLDEVPVPLPRQ
jgi:hypothetical protein